MLLLGVPLGVILGYIMTAFLVVYVHWKWTFYIQAGLLVPLALCFMFTPARYIIFQGSAKGAGDDVSKITDSMNYYNLSNFESKPFHRRDSSYFIAQS